MMAWLGMVAYSKAEWPDAKDGSRLGNVTFGWERLPDVTAE
jgi:hypothetical protein